MEPRIGGNSEGRPGSGDEHADDNAAGGELTGSGAADEAQATTTIELTDTETSIYEDLYGRLAQVKREISVAYTVSLGARNITGKKVLETDLPNKRLVVQK